MRAKKGFLLVEILISISVVAITLGALFQVFSHALRNSNAAKQTQVASYLAEKVIWETLWEPTLNEGWTDGLFEEEPGMKWSREITLLYRPDPEDEDDSSFTVGSKDTREKLPDTDLFFIRVYVNWIAQGKEKSYELATYHLVPSPEEFFDQNET